MKKRIILTTSVIIMAAVVLSFSNSYLSGNVVYIEKSEGVFQDNALNGCGSASSPCDEGIKPLESPEVKVQDSKNRIQECYDFSSHSYIKNDECNRMMLEQRSIAETTIDFDEFKHSVVALYTEMSSVEMTSILKSYENRSELGFEDFEIFDLWWIAFNSANDTDGVSALFDKYWSMDQGSQQLWKNEVAKSTRFHLLRDETRSSAIPNAKKLLDSVQINEVGLPIGWSYIEYEELNSALENQTDSIGYVIDSVTDSANPHAAMALIDETERHCYTIDENDVLCKRVLESLPIKSVLLSAKSDSRYSDDERTIFSEYLAKM